jgi:hypothetical protein
LNSLIKPVSFIANEYTYAATDAGFKENRLRSREGNAMEPENGRYRHFKGAEYEVLGIARHSETLEELVVYRALYGEGGLWVRPRAMFLEQVAVEGKKRPRFARIDESD